MTAPRFDLDALRRRTGDKVFQRGEGYARDGAVQLVAIQGDRVVARVFGSETYRTSVSGAGRALDAACTCLFGVEFGVCKHVVALALVANDLKPEELRPLVGRLERVREKLAGQDASALVDLILDAAIRHPDLLDELDPEDADPEHEWDDD